jgi:hypothetical protein
MRRSRATWLLVASASLLWIPGVRADGERPCPPPPCGPCPSTVSCPPAKIIVDIPPPEVTVRPAPAAVAAQPPHAGLCERLLQCCHKRHAVPVYVQPAAMPAYVAVQQAAVPAFATASVAPVSVAAVPMQTMSYVPAQPASFAPATFAPASLATVPVQTMSVAAMPSVAPSAMPVQVPTVSFMPSAVGAAPSSLCMSSASSAGTASLSELIQYKIKAQELESRATTIMLQSMKDSMQMHQMALATLLPKTSEVTNGQASPSSVGSGAGAASKQVEDLSNSMRQLESRLNALISYIEQREKK